MIVQVMLTLFAIVVVGYVAGKTEYRTVAINDPVNVKGHWVQKSGSGDYMALRDHQLVDKQDFNAPMRYTFDSYTDNENVEHGYRMWYQRNPDNFAGQEKDMDENGNPVLRSDAGWESISRRTRHDECEGRDHALL